MQRLFAIVSLLVGLGLFLGFGGIAIDAALDLHAFPDRPSPWTLQDLADLKRVPRGLWVRVRGSLEVVAGPVQPNAGGPHYLLVSDAEQSAYLVVAGDALDATRQWTGVPSIHRTTADGADRPLPHGLMFPGVPWGRMPGGRVVVLWTHSGPKDSRIGVVICPVFALVGLFVMFSSLRNLRRPRALRDVVWSEAELPKAVRLGPRAGRQTWLHALVLLGLGLSWLVAFGALELTQGKLGLRSALLLSVGGVLLALGVALAIRARRVSGHRYFADLLWLPVLRTFAVRSEGIATGVQAYELELPAGSRPATRTVHSGALYGGLVFRDPSRAEVLGARPLHSTEVLVLSSTLEEIEDNPLAPLAHVRHRARPLD